ncbi:MAG: hypothetical protein AAGM21_04325 [Pseudomonadota bacterium]
MALEKESIQEIKRYMDERAEHWQANVRNETTKSIDDEFARRDQTASKRLQAIAAVGGVSIAAILTFAYTGLSSYVESLANARIDAFTEDVDARREERGKALDAELKFLSESIERVVEGRVSVGTAVEGAQSALEEARVTLGEAEGNLSAAQELETELEKRLTEAKQAIDDNAALTERVAANTDSVTDALLSSDRLSAALNAALLDAENQLRELRALSSALDEAKALAAEIDSSRANVVDAVLQNASLREQIATTAALPTGAVMAFDLPGGCPAPWTPFAPSQGRTVVGAAFGIDDELLRDPPPQYKYRDHGGAAEVTLLEDQMPSHTHTLENNGKHSGFLLAEGNLNRGVVSTIRNEETVSAGGNRPHPNMPPYIALFYCKKS